MFCILEDNVKMTNEYCYGIPSHDIEIASSYTEARLSVVEIVHEDFQITRFI